MIYAKAKPKGIDAVIYRLQQRIDKIDMNNYSVYGRLYSVEKDGKKTPDAYIKSNEYREFLFDDKKHAIFGFFVSTERDMFPSPSVKVEMVCLCNLNKLYSAKVERYDEEYMLMIYNWIFGYIPKNNDIKIKTGVSDIFGDFDLEKYKYIDNQPYFCFSISFDVEFSLDEC